MQELLKATKKIEGILHECERDGNDFAQTLGKISDVKAHGVSFPTLMLMEIIDEFVKGRDDRQKSNVLKGFDEKKLEEKFRQVQLNWNNRDTIN
jgi:hypothetical protein